MRFAVRGASGRQGQRYLDPKNWPEGVECFALPRDAEPPPGTHGLIVATPPASHLAYVLASTLPTLCEKPAAPHLDEVERMFSAGPPLLIAHTHLWHRDFLALPKSSAATVSWCGEERTDGSCSALLDWGPHAWSMALALGTERVTTGVGDRSRNLVQSDGLIYPNPAGDRPGYATPMSNMLASFATVVGGGYDWRADKAFQLAIYERLFRT